MNATHARAAILAAAILAAAILVGGCERPPESPPGPLTPLDRPAAAEDESEWPRTFNDDLGGEVTLDGPAERVVSIAPGLTEAIFALDAEDRLVGRSDFCYYPPEALKVPSVGGTVNPSVEAVVGLEPDLVLVIRGTPTEVIESLRGAGLNVMAHGPSTLSEVIEDVRALGRYLGIESRADRLADELARRRDAVAGRGRAMLTGGRRPTVLFVVEVEPVFAAGPGSFVHDMIELSGGANVVAGSGGEVSPWPQLSLEAVVDLDPDIIVAALEGHTGEAGALAMLRDRDGWRELTAVQKRRVFDVDPDLMVRSGPRLIDGLERMAEIVRQVAGGEPADG